MNNLRNIRERLGINQSEPACVIGLKTAGVICHYEKRRRDLSVAKCRKIIEALKEKVFQFHLTTLFHRTPLSNTAVQ